MHDLTVFAAGLFAGCGHKIYNKPNDNNLFCGHCSARMDGGAE